MRRLASLLFVLAALLHAPPTACCATPTDGERQVTICSLHGMETIPWSAFVGEPAPREAPTAPPDHSCCDGCVGSCRADAAAVAIAPTPAALAKPVAFHVLAAPPPVQAPLASAPARAFAARAPPAFA